MSNTPKDRPTPPPSPLQRMKTPFTRRPSLVPLSFRVRSKTRLSLLFFSLFIAISILNELRCAKYGCISRVGFHSGGTGRKGGWTGGGAVLPVPSAATAEAGANGKEAGLGTVSAAGSFESHDVDDEAARFNVGAGDLVAPSAGRVDGWFHSKSGKNRWSDAQSETPVSEKPKKGRPYGAPIQPDRVLPPPAHSSINNAVAARPTSQAHVQASNAASRPLRISAGSSGKEVANLPASTSRVAVAVAAAPPRTPTLAPTTPSKPLKKPLPSPSAPPNQPFRIKVHQSAAAPQPSRFASSLGEMKLGTMDMSVFGGKA